MTVSHLTLQSTITPDAVFLLQLESGGVYPIQRSFLPFWVLSGTRAPQQFCLLPERSFCAELESMSLFSFHFTATANQSEFAFCVSSFYLDYFSLMKVFHCPKSSPEPIRWSCGDAFKTSLWSSFLVCTSGPWEKRHLNELGMYLLFSFIFHILSPNRITFFKVRLEMNIIEND